MYYVILGAPRYIYQQLSILNQFTMNGLEMRFPGAPQLSDTNASVAD